MSVVRSVTVSVPPTVGVTVRPVSSTVEVAQYDALNRCTAAANSAESSADNASSSAAASAASAVSAAASAASAQSYAASINSGIAPEQIPQNWMLGSGAFQDIRFLNGSVSWDAGSVNSGAQTSTTVSVPGASLGDFVFASASGVLSGMQLSGEVTASGTVTIYLSNLTGAPVDLGSLTYYAKVLQR